MADFRGKRVVVMGLGRFGGGVGATRYLVGQGARVLVTDMAPQETLRPSLADVADLPLEYRLGEHRESDFTSSDLIVVSPAVDRRDNHFLRAAASAGVAITSEIRLLTSRLPNRDRTIGVTGTAGKSTVTSMVGHVLGKKLSDGRNRRVHVGGNLGGSLLTTLDQIRPDHWVVLELSSFMLEGLAEDRWSPHIAVVTNIMPNPLDRHRTFEEYVQAKQAILRHQNDRDIAFLGDTVQGWPTAGRTRAVATPSDRQLPLLIPGVHNQCNAHMALSVCREILESQDDFTGALEDFAGLPHRLQLVAEHGNVRYFNDSKSTTPESAMLALRSFPSGIIHVILGGYDKHSDLNPLTQLAVERCRVVYTVGATGEPIASACERAGGRAVVVRCGTVENAVSQSVGRVHRGDVVLFSPACASWDQFENFEAHGSAFVDAVLQCTGAEVSPPGG